MQGTKRGRRRKEVCQTRIDSIRTQAWLAYIIRQHDELGNAGLKPPGSMTVQLRHWLNSLDPTIIPENTGKLEKWLGGAHAPSKSTLNLIERHIPGSEKAWTDGPGGSQLFKALSMSYEELWGIAGVTRQAMASYVAHDGRFSENITQILGAYSHASSSLQVFARFVAIWRIIWMSMHSWKEVEQLLQAYLQDARTRDEMENGGICIHALCEVLNMLRSEYTWSDRQGRTDFLAGIF